MAVVPSKRELTIYHDRECVEGRAPVAVCHARSLFKVLISVGCDVAEMNLDVIISVLAVVLMCCTCTYLGAAKRPVVTYP